MPSQEWTREMDEHRLVLVGSDEIVKLSSVSVLWQSVGTLLTLDRAPGTSDTGVSACFFWRQSTASVYAFRSASPRLPLQN
jgi:hypothetical protein